VGAAALAGLAPKRYSDYAPAIALLVVGVVSFFSLSFYFGRYADGNYYSDQVTRNAEQFTADIRRVVPAGSTVYWLITDLVNPGHPAVDYGLREYQVLMLTEDGEVRTADNPKGVDGREDSVAFVFMGKRLPEAPQFERDCASEAVKLPAAGAVPPIQIVLAKDTCGHIPAAS
jgi:hypothetical protein